MMRLLRPRRSGSTHELVEPAEEWRFDKPGGLGAFVAEEGAIKAAMDARELFLYEDIYFEFDKSDLLAESQEVLRGKAEYLKDNPDVLVIIEGHCDERGTNEYNLALGDRRASSAKAFLVNLGIAGSRLTSVSYGEERPADPGHDEEAWSKNRRAHFAID